MSANRPVRVYLVRHCESSGQQPDAPLTALGAAQAEQLAAFLRPFGVGWIVSSPFRRARQSVEPLARSLGLPITLDERLVERTLSSESLADWRERLRASWHDFDLALPGGESSRTATERGLAALLDVVAAGTAPAVVASHGNLLSLVLHALDGRPGYATWEALTNPDVFRAEPAAIDAAPGAWAVTRLWPG